MLSQIEHERPGDELPTILASLEILGFGEDPSVVTEALGIEPSRSGRVGEPYRNAANRLTTRVIRESFWELDSDAGHRATVEEHLSTLLGRFRPAKSRIASLPSGASLLVRFTIIPSTSGPRITMPPAIIREVGEIGAAVDIRIVTVSGFPDDLATE